MILKNLPLLKLIHLGHTNTVRSLCVFDDESTFLSGGRDQKLLIWKVENQNDNSIKLGFCYILFNKLLFVNF